MTAEITTLRQRAQVQVGNQIRVALPIDKVPANVLKTAQAKFLDVKFDTAWKLSSGAIEVRGKNKIGKVHEVEMSASGEIVETN
jgi:hypothetical protein